MNLSVSYVASSLGNGGVFDKMNKSVSRLILPDLNCKNECEVISQRTIFGYGAFILSCWTVGEWHEREESVEHSLL